MKITENECCMVIAKNWSDCPQCWCNFVRSLELPEHDTDWERTRSINDGLVELVPDEKKEYVLFFSLPLCIRLGL